jgi:hypothetical protein
VKNAIFSAKCTSAIDFAAAAPGRDPRHIGEHLVCDLPYLACIQMIFYQWDGILDWLDINRYFHWYAFRG